MKKVLVLYNMATKNDDKKKKKTAIKKTVKASNKSSRKILAKKSEESVMAEELIQITEPIKEGEIVETVIEQELIPTEDHTELNTVVLGEEKSEDTQTEDGSIIEEVQLTTGDNTIESIQEEGVENKEIATSELIGVTNEIQEVSKPTENEVETPAVKEKLVEKKKIKKNSTAIPFKQHGMSYYWNGIMFD